MRETFVVLITKMAEAVLVRIGAYHRCFVCRKAYNLQGAVVGGGDEGVCSDRCYTLGWEHPELVDFSR